MTKEKKPEGSLPSLGALLQAIDTQVRESAVKAHVAVVKECARIEGHKICETEIPAEALLPRDLLYPQKYAMEFELMMTDKGVSLTRGLKSACFGTNAKVVMEWEAHEAPEATALVRTKAETIVASLADKPEE